MISYGFAIWFGLQSSIKDLTDLSIPSTNILMSLEWPDLVIRVKPEPNSLNIEDHAVIVMVPCCHCHNVTVSWCLLTSWCPGVTAGALVLWRVRGHGESGLSSSPSQLPWREELYNQISKRAGKTVKLFWQKISIKFTITYKGRKGINM